MSGPTKICPPLSTTRPILRAHTGIDNTDVDSAGRKVADCGEQGKGAGAHVLGRDVVGDVHEGDVLSFIRQPGEDHSFHLGGVKGAEVGEQRYDLTFFLLILPITLFLFYSLS